MTSSKAEYVPREGENQPDREYEVAHVPTAGVSRLPEPEVEGDENAAPPPPTYEDVLSERTAELSVAPSTPAVPSRPTPPEDAQRALAPLKLQYTNDAIKGAYAVDIGENKSGPDVHFKSTNGAVRVSLFLRGTVPRPAEVQLETTNGGIKAVLADRDDGQPLLVRATSTNGSINLSIPRDFDGIIALRTSNGSKTLADDVKAKSVIVPNEPGADSKTISYRVKPEAKRRDDDTTATWHTAPSTVGAASDNGTTVDDDRLTSKADDEDTPATGLDLAELRSTNGSVRVVYFDPEAEAAAEEKKKDGCVIA
ncbi:uncharacterized protein LOC62_06G007876 [Vanrija pseudolonga]|uniref:DUF7330 domain-containing protein n=1 Tax=Vanrija pseudolonga TaxID=143232 RepID=A0AAF1BK82_9TREE|nr:hypothetical protein LOC62_06G007876 [Vanrija pseudolonga]